MKAKEEKKGDGKGKILATCPLCEGKGKIPREIPFQANPEAPATRAYRLGFRTCPKCQGRGRLGIE